MDNQTISAVKRKGSFKKSGYIPFKGAVGGHLIKSAAFLFTSLAPPGAANAPDDINLRYRTEHLKRFLKIRRSVR